MKLKELFENINFIKAEIDSIVNEFEQYKLNIQIDLNIEKVIYIKDISVDNENFLHMQDNKVYELFYSCIDNVLSRLIDFAELHKLSIAINYKCPSLISKIKTYLINQLQQFGFKPNSYYKLNMNDFNSSMFDNFLILIPSSYTQKLYVPNNLNYNLSENPRYNSILKTMQAPITLDKIYNKLPWPNKVNRFIARKIHLKSIIGGPTYITTEYNISENDIDSLIGLPKYIGTDLNIHGNEINSLHDIHMHVNYIGHRIIIPNTIQSHIIGLMKIQGLKKVMAYGGTSELSNAIQIMNRHLDGKGNFFDCLEELEDAGLEEFAQL